MRSLPLRSIWQIVSEINLAEIQDEVAAPFHLLIAAEEERYAEQTARFLSAADASFVHPWVTVTDGEGSGLRSKAAEVAHPPPSGLDHQSSIPARTPDCAVLVSRQLELSPNLAALQHALNAQSLPALIVIVGREGDRPGSAIARRGEQGRVAIGGQWDRHAVERVAGALIDIVPQELRLPLARQMPPLRTASLSWLIQETSRANAGYSFTTGLGETVPGLGIVLGAGDAIILTKNQLMMAYKIALVSGKTGSPQELLGEVVGVLGGGFLFRQVARQMVGLIPVWGIVPKVAIAYAGTWAIGRATALWAAEGRRLTPELMKGFYQEALKQGRTAALSIVDRAHPPRRTEKAARPLPGKKPLASRLLRRMRKRMDGRAPGPK